MLVTQRSIMDWEKTGNNSQKYGQIEILESAKKSAEVITLEDEDEEEYQKNNIEESCIKPKIQFDCSNWLKPRVVYSQSEMKALEPQENGFMKCPLEEKLKPSYEFVDSPKLPLKDHDKAKPAITNGSLPKFFKEDLCDKAGPSNDKTSSDEISHKYFYYRIQYILSNVDEKEKLSAEEINESEKFLNISSQSQKLYAKIFNQPVAWKNYNSVECKGICKRNELALYLHELCAVGFIRSEEELTDLSKILMLLEKKDLYALAKEFKVTKDIKKKVLVNNLIKLSKEQKSISSMLSGASQSKSILQTRAKSMLGHCFIINSTGRTIFKRLLCYMPQAKTSVQAPVEYANVAVQVAFRMTPTPFHLAKFTKILNELLQSNGLPVFNIPSKILD